MKKSYEVFSKDWLVSQNIEIEGYDIYHTTPYKGRVKLTPIKNVRHHKYGKDMEYMIVGWYSRQDHRQYSFSLQRMLYAWYWGPIEDGMDIDHKDNDSLNNDIFNLQKITHKENMQKRLGGGRNQYIIMKEQGMSKKAQDSFWEECGDLIVKGDK